MLDIVVLLVYYEYIEKRATIIRNNQNFLLEFIEPNDKLIEALVSSACITQHQADSIGKLQRIRDKNEELLQQLRPYESDKYAAFKRCLYETDQHSVARVLENGGGSYVILLKLFYSNLLGRWQKWLHVGLAR